MTVRSRQQRWIDVTVEEEAVHAGVDDSGRLLSDLDLDSEYVGLQMTGTTSPKAMFLLALRELLAGAKDPLAELARLIGDYESDNPRFPSHPLRLAIRALSPDGASHSSRYVRTPEVAKEMLAHDSVAWVRGGVARRTRLVHVASKLARDHESHVRSSAALNPCLPEAELRRLLADPDPQVRASAAKSRNLSPKDGMAIANDASSQSKSQRIALARSGRDPELLKRLAESQDPQVRVRAAMNPRTPSHSVLALSFDQDPVVRRVAARRRELPSGRIEELARDPKAEVRAAVAQRSEVDPVVLESLSRDGALVVLRAVAYNKKTPAGALEQLAYRSDVTIQRHLSWNRSTPAAALRHLAAVGDRSVVAAISRNKSATADVQQIVESRRGELQL